MRISSNALPRMPPKIGYLTDVEGNYEFFCNYISRSSIIGLDQQGELIFKGANTLFVYGGDSCDKGYGSIRVTKKLVAFKKKYPDRVFLMLGNRDINKMRWTSELAQTEIDNLDSVPGPYWVTNELQRVSPKAFLTKMLASPAVPPGATLQSLNTVANRIRWMLEATMGAAGDFERRRSELAILANKQAEDITDEDVVTSYQESVKPGGETYQYLELGQIAFIHGCNFFVHGTINVDNLGWVPFNKKPIENLNDWVKELNNWFKLELLDWTKKPLWNYKDKKFDASIQGIPEQGYLDKAKWSVRGAHAALDYCLPTAKKSVVYGHMFNNQFNCQPINQDLKKRLMEQGIQRIVTGHQPSGNAPSVMKDSDEDFEIVCVDSSFSDLTAPDNRGKAVSEVVIEGKHLTVKGILHDETPIDYKLSVERGKGDNLIGRKLPVPPGGDENSFWVKAKLGRRQANGADYLICKVEGFKVAYEYMTRRNLEQKIFNKKLTPPDELSMSMEEDVVEIMYDGVKLTKLPTVDKKLQEIVTVRIFDQWFKNIRKEKDLTLESVEIQSVDEADYRVRFIKLNAAIRNKSGRYVGGVVFLRGNSIAVLCVLTTETGEKKVVTIRHARVPIGMSDYLEIPVGMEDELSPFGIIFDLLLNEANIEIDETTRPINLREYLYGNTQIQPHRHGRPPSYHARPTQAQQVQCTQTQSPSQGDARAQAPAQSHSPNTPSSPFQGLLSKKKKNQRRHRHKPHSQPTQLIYPSPGSCDQGVRYYLIETEITDAQAKELKKKARENPDYKAVLVNLSRLEEFCNDGNAIIAARLYELYLQKRRAEIENGEI